MNRSAGRNLSRRSRDMFWAALPSNGRVLGCGGLVFLSFADYSRLVYEEAPRSIRVFDRARADRVRVHAARKHKRV